MTMARRGPAVTVATAAALLALSSCVRVSPELRSQQNNHAATPTRSAAVGLGASPEDFRRIYGASLYVTEERCHQAGEWDVTATFTNGVCVAVRYTRAKSRAGRTTAVDTLSDDDVAKLLSKSDPSGVGWNKRHIDRHDTHWSRKDGKAIASLGEGSVLQVFDAGHFKSQLTGWFSPEEFEPTSSSDLERKPDVSNKASESSIAPPPQVQR